MHNLLPDQQTGFLGWLLIVIVGLFMGWHIWQILRLIHMLLLFFDYVSVPLVLDFLIPIIFQVALLLLCAGVLLRIKRAIAGLWIVGIMLTLWMITISYAHHYIQTSRISLMLLFSEFVLVTLLSRPVWAFFRPYQEVRAEGISFSMIFAPPDASGTHETSLPHDANDKPPHPPQADTQNQPWF